MSGVEALPGGHRPDWVIWAALAGMIAVLLLLIFFIQGGSGGKNSKKVGPPYF